jgi:molybdenum cofactor cytidylyltransferase
MGQPKALLPWRGDTAVVHLHEVWTTAGAVQAAAVYDPSNLRIEREVDRIAGLEGIENPLAGEGMMSSLKAAAVWPSWAPGLEHVAIALVDQPQVPLPVVRDLLELARSNPGSVCQLQCGNVRGHPLVLPWKVFVGIAATHEATLRHYLGVQPGSRQSLAIAEAWWLEDMDTPEDYRRLVAMDSGDFPEGQV